MIQIRKGAFETNSSSMHAIVISDSKKQDYDYSSDHAWWYEKGNIMINDLYFGRAPFQILGTWLDKLCYVIASEIESNDELLEIVQKHYPAVTGFTFCNGVVNGCIDHQSCGILTSFLKKKNVSVEDFIFDNKYSVVIDGDEYCFIDQIQALGFKKPDNMEIYQ